MEAGLPGSKASGNPFFGHMVRNDLTVRAVQEQGNMQVTYVGAVF